MKKVNSLNVKILSSFSYIGPLFIISKFAVEKGDKNVKFHYKQGKFLFLTMAVLLSIVLILDFLVSHFLESISVIFFLVYIGLTVMWLILALMGIVSAIKNTEIKLPLISEFIKNMENKNERKK